MVFRIGSIPVRVHGWFWLMALMLGANDRRPEQVLVWVAVVFVSVLLHELGHALVGKAFGLTPQIDLHGMGGTTSWVAWRNVGSLRRALISLAGPLAGLLFGGVVYALARSGSLTGSSLASSAVGMLLWVNFGWSLFNLVPMLPLDGGNVMLSVLNGLTRGRGESPARAISILIAALGVAYAIKTQQIWLGVLTAFIAVSNVRALKRPSQAELDAPLAEAIPRANAALEDHDGAKAIAFLRPHLSPHVSPGLRETALRQIAYALLLEGRWSELMGLLEAERHSIGEGELSRFAHTARELGRAEEAAQIAGLMGGFAHSAKA